MELIKFFENIDLTGYTLIIPSVSTGNLPQLTVDIIISTHGLKRAGMIWHPAIDPLVGGDAFSKESTELTTACELFANEELKLAVIQLRTRIDPKYAVAFFELLIDSIKFLKFKNLVILTSQFAHEMHNQYIVYRYISSGDVIPRETLANSNLQESTADELNIGTGIGFAMKLYKLALEKSIKTCIFSKYVSEGENRPDAMQMLLMLYGLFENFQFNANNASSYKFSFPSSWELLYGNTQPIDIY